VERVRSADDQLEPFPVDAIRLLILLEVLEQGGNPVKGGRAVALYSRENLINVGGCEKHQCRSQGETAQHHHHLSIDVEKREKSHAHFLPFFKKGPEREDLGLEGNHVAMGQDGRFGQACGASCVGQDSDVFARVNGDLRGLGRVFVNQILEREKSGFLDLLGGWHMHAAIGLGQSTLSEPLLESGKILTDACEDHPVQVYSGLLHITVENVLTDHGLCFTVFELMFDLLARVNRADGRYLGAQFEGGEIGDHVLRAIQQIERHGIALLHTLVSKACGKPMDQFLETAIGDFFPIKDQCRLAGVLVRQPVDQFRHREVRDLRGFRHAVRIMLQPRFR
jgi:hypothetical protein